MLIVRDAFLGRSRFSEFQRSLGIARNILTQRLAHLVEEDVFEHTRRRRATSSPARAASSPPPSTSS